MKRLIICTPYPDKENRIDREYSKNQTDEECIYSFGRKNLKVKVNLEELDIDSGAMLKWVIRKCVWYR
jgi:hypothetical protein